MKKLDVNKYGIVRDVVFTEFVEKIYPYICEQCEFIPVIPPNVFIGEQFKLNGENDTTSKGCCSYTSFKEGDVVKIRSVFNSIYIDANSIIGDLEYILDTDVKQTTIEGLVKATIIHELIHYVDFKKISALGVGFYDKGYGHEPYMVDHFIHILTNHSEELKSKGIMTEIDLMACKIDISAGLIYRGDKTNQEWGEIYKNIVRKINA